MAGKQARPSQHNTKAAPSHKPPTTKLDALTAMLRSPKGATLEAMMNATGWQQHSIRGVLAGALKKQRKLVIRSERKDGVRVYYAEA